MMDALTAHFSLAEFTASDTAKRQHIDNSLPDALRVTAVQTCSMMERIRARLCTLAGREIPIAITSGYRCAALNSAIGSVATSDHPRAMAVDFRAAGFGTPFEIAAALAAGRAVLGNPARASLHVLYIDRENAAKMVRERLDGMGYGPTDLGRLHYLSFPSLHALDTLRGGAQLLEIARRHAVQVVVIDTTSRVIEGEENNADTFKALYRHAIMPLKAEGIAVLRIDHAGKDLERGARGSSAKNDDVDAVWLLSKRTETRLDLRRTHNRTGHGADLVELVRQVDPHLSHVVTGGTSTVDAVVLELVAELDRLGVAPAAGRDAARGALRMAGQTVANGTLAKALAYRKRASQLSADRSDSDGTQDELATVREPVRTVPDPRSKPVRGQVADSADSSSPGKPVDLSASPPPIGGTAAGQQPPTLRARP